MDKLYSLPSLNNTLTPKKETLQFIMQFAAAYESIAGDATALDFIAN